MDNLAVPMFLSILSAVEPKRDLISFLLFQKIEFPQKIELLSKNSVFQDDFYFPEIGPVEGMFRVSALEKLGGSCWVRCL